MQNNNDFLNIPVPEREYDFVEPKLEGGGNNNYNLNIKSGANNVKWKQRRSKAAKLFNRDDLNTAEGVANFQQAHGLKVDGMLGIETLNALNEVHDKNYKLSDLGFQNKSKRKKSTTPSVSSYPGFIVTAKRTSKKSSTNTDPSRASSYIEALSIVAQNNNLPFETYQDVLNIVQKYGNSRELSGWKGTRSYKDFYNTIAKLNTNKVEDVASTIVTAPLDPIGSAKHLAEIVYNDITGQNIREELFGSTYLKLAPSMSLNGYIMKEAYAQNAARDRRALTEQMNSRIVRQHNYKPIETQIVSPGKPTITSNKPIVRVKRFKRNRKAAVSRQYKEYRDKGYNRIDINKLRRQYGLDFKGEKFSYAFVTDNNTITIFNKGGILSQFNNRNKWE